MVGNDLLKSILVVDDEVGARESLKMILKGEYQVFLAKNAEDAFRTIDSQIPDVILLDIILPDMDGLKVLERLKQTLPDQIVIMITATKTVKTAVEAMKLGAYDYITKPFDVDELRLIVNRALSTRALKEENQRLWMEVDRSFGFDNIVGKSKGMKEIFKMVKQVADTRATVLIMGESGTGKELISRAIHYHSPRKNHPFVTINCAAIPETLIEGELYGHEKGFVPAHQERAVSGGSLLPDQCCSHCPSPLARTKRGYSVIGRQFYKEIQRGEPKKFKGGQQRGIRIDGEL